MMLKDRPQACFVLLFVFLAAQSCLGYPVNDLTPVLQYTIIDQFPHDPNAFTQGLVWHEGFFYESTGLYGASTLRKVNPETGKIMQKFTLPHSFFGEGMTIFQDKIYQLTWREGTGFIYDLKTFELLDTFSYSHEGWGITHDETYLIISDGTATLRYIDPQNMTEVKEVMVYDGLALIPQINELEYIGNYIYANIWQSNKIALIEPESGKVAYWLDLSKIVNNLNSSKAVDVLNGIAYDSENDRIFITGKLWPVLFEIQVNENDL